VCSSWLFVVMLLTCSLPMAALCLMLGGVSTGEIVWAYLMLCLIALLYASWGVFCSVVTSRSSVASMLAYAGVFATNIAAPAMDPMNAGLGRALSPFGFVYSSTDPIAWFSFHLPSWLPGLVVFFLLIALLLNWATTRLLHFSVNRAPVIRLLTAAMMVGLLLLALGSAAIPYANSGLVTIITASVALLFLALVFATGDAPALRVRSLTGWLARGLDPRRMFSGEANGGWSYLLLLAALFGATLRVASLASRGAPAASASNPFRRAWLAPATLGLSASGAWEIFLLLGAVLLCLSALGAVGVALRSRRAAMALMLGFLLVTQLLPGIIWLHDIAVTGSSKLVRATDYLAPYIGVTLIADPSLAKTLLPAGSQTHGAMPFWQVSAAIYLALAALFVVVAEIQYRVNRRPKPAAAAGSGG
jgi:hypothetical protein